MRHRRPKTFFWKCKNATSKIRRIRKCGPDRTCTTSFSTPGSSVGTPKQPRSFCGKYLSTWLPRCPTPKLFPHGHVGPVPRTPNDCSRKCCTCTNKRETSPSSPTATLIPQLFQRGLVASRAHAVVVSVETLPTWPSSSFINHSSHIPRVM